MTILELNNKELLKTYNAVKNKDIPFVYKLKLVDYIKFRFYTQFIKIFSKYKISLLHQTFIWLKKNFNDCNYKCPICFEFNKKPIFLHCGHHFHEKCILSWLDLNKDTCPVCRINLIPD